MGIVPIFEAKMNLSRQLNHFSEKINPILRPFSIVIILIPDGFNRMVNFAKQNDSSLVFATLHAF